MHWVPAPQSQVSFPRFPPPLHAAPPPALPSGDPHAVVCEVLFVFLVCSLVVFSFASQALVKSGGS